MRCVQLILLLLGNLRFSDLCDVFSLADYWHLIRRVAINCLVASTKVEAKLVPCHHPTS